MEPEDIIVLNLKDKYNILMILMINDIAVLNLDNKNKTKNTTGQNKTNTSGHGESGHYTKTQTNAAGHKDSDIIVLNLQDTNKT